MKHFSSSKACSSCFSTLLLWTGYTATQAHHKWALPRHLYLIKDSSFPLVCTHNVLTLKGMAQIIPILWTDYFPPILAIFSYFNIFLIWGTSEQHCSLKGIVNSTNSILVIVSVDICREHGKQALLSWAQMCHSFGTPYLVSLISSYKNMEDFPADFKRSLHFTQSKHLLCVQ